MEAKSEPKKRIKKRFALININFFLRKAGYTLFYHKMNERILENLKAEPDNLKLRGYKSNWLRLVTRMNWMPKIMPNY